MPNLTCTPTQITTKAHSKVVEVEHEGGKAYGKGSGLYTKNCKYSELWNLRHPFLFAYDFQPTQSFHKQTKSWINNHLRSGMNNFKNKSLKSADALRKLLSELHFGLGDDSWIEDHFHILGTFYYR